MYSLSRNKPQSIQVNCNCGLEIKTYNYQTECECGRKFEYSGDSGGDYVKQINMMDDEKPLLKYYKYYSV